MAGTGTGIPASSALALSVADAKVHLRIDSTDTSHDAHINSLIGAVTNICESFLGRYLLTGTRTKKYDAFPASHFELPAPLSSVTSITYYDTANAIQTLSSAYYVLDGSDADRPFQRVRLAYSYSWPSVYDKNDCITVTYVSGWATAADIPAAIVAGLKLAVESLFDDRPGLMPTAELLWWPYRWVPL